jgi:hypothetical protein
MVLIRNEAESIVGGIEKKIIEIYRVSLTVRICTIDAAGV